MRTSSELMTLFVGLLDHEFRAAPVELWNETFTSWASVHRRSDDESTGQLAEYETFLRASVWYLKQLSKAPPRESLGYRAGGEAEIVLQEIFAHVARRIAFAEHKVLGGKMPRDEESAVLRREALLQLLDDDDAKMLDEAIRRELEEHGSESNLSRGR